MIFLEPNSLENDDEIIAEFSLLEFKKSFLEFVLVKSAEVKFVFSRREMYAWPTEIIESKIVVATIIEKNVVNARNFDFFEWHRIMKIACMLSNFRVNLRFAHLLRL